jgi:hypothetical protein
MGRCTTGDAIGGVTERCTAYGVTGVGDAGGRVAIDGTDGGEVFAVSGGDATVGAAVCALDGAGAGGSTGAFESGGGVTGGSTGVDVRCATVRSATAAAGFVGAAGASRKMTSERPLNPSATAATP